MNDRSLGRLGSLRHFGPTVLVVTALGALGIYGHRTGWRLPKRAALFPSGNSHKEDWCSTHNVPDSRCIACHPELGGAEAKDWCKEHGVPESKCTVCHPEILTTGKAGEWCPEHGTPESQCTICHAEIAVKGEPPAPVVSVIVTIAPDAKPAKNPRTCQLHEVRVQFASAASVRKAGIELAGVQERPMVARVDTQGEADYDQTLLARVAPRAAGSVWRVEKQVGEWVKAGELLALIDSSEVGRAKSELLQALGQLELRTKTHKRIAASAQTGLRTEAEIQEAEAALREARIRVFNAQQSLANLGLRFRLEDLASLSDQDLVEKVRWLGLSEALVKTLDEKRATASLLPVTAPLDGVIVHREVVAGEVIETTRTIFVVADTSRMWVNADVRVEDTDRIALGQGVAFRPDGDADFSVAGRVAWMSTAVDEKTRTVRVRAHVENSDGRLRARVFGRASIITREAPAATAVPNDAIHWEGCCHVVFVRLTDDIFATRKVKLGARSTFFTEVTIGVLPGEVVATKGSYVLKSEVLKSRLGAGCCD